MISDEDIDRNLNVYKKEFERAQEILRKNRHNSVYPYQWFGPGEEPNVAGSGCACAGCQARME